MYTKYSHMSNDELLRRFSEQCQHSPIIGELCDRFEELINEAEDAEPNNDDVSDTTCCPVCESQLTATLGDDKFTLEPKV